MRRGAALTILLAMLAYCAAATFLEFYAPQSAPGEGITHLDVATRSFSEWGALRVTSGILQVFGGPLLIAALAVATGSGRSGPGPLVAAVAAWAAITIGFSLGLIATYDEIPLGVGFWVETAAAVVAVLGAIVLLVGRDRPAPVPPSTGD